MSEQVVEEHPLAPVFLSASVPDPSRHAAYFQTARPARIREAVTQLARVVLPHGLLVFGGHPAISPLVLKEAIAGALVAARGTAGTSAECTHTRSSRHRGRRGGQVVRRADGSAVGGCRASPPGHQCIGRAWGQRASKSRKNVGSVGRQASRRMTSCRPRSSTWAGIRMKFCTKPRKSMRSVRVCSA